MWIGGQSMPSVRRAAAIGDGWVVAWPLGDEDWKQLTDEYRQGCVDAGKRPEICVSRHCWVGESRAEVEKWFVPMWLEEMKYYWSKGQLKHPDFRSVGDFTIENARKHVIVGSPEDLTICPALPEEANEPELAHLHRLCLTFDRKAYGRLRQLIDRLNEF